MTGVTSGSAANAGSTATVDPRAEPGRVWMPSLLLVVGCAALLCWVTLDVVFDGPWHRADLALAQQVDAADLRGRTVPNAVLWLLSQTGGRGTILVVIAALTLYVMRVRRVWQPLLRLAVTLLLLTVVVYALKVGLGRTAPGAGVSRLYVDGLSYPSGHSANAVLWWGTAVWLVRTYRMPAWLVGTCTAMALAAPVLTTVSMLALNYHWLTDVVAGLGLGVVLLWLVNLLFETRLGQWGNGSWPAGARPRVRADRGLLARPGAVG